MKAKFQELLQRYPTLTACSEEILRLEELITDTYRRGGKLLICGNGGSCADSDHIVGELMKGFLQLRPVSEAQKAQFEQALESEDAAYFAKHLQQGLPAISLPAQAAILSAFANDVAPDLVYAQMVFGYAKENDLFLGLSTSGNSKNVVYAAKAAKALGLRCAALTGTKESKLSAICDCTVRVPECETFKVQELHLPVYHYLCAAVEETFFG